MPIDVSGLVEEVLGELSGHTQFQGQTTHLTQAMTDSDLEVKVDDLSGFAKGLVEVGYELIQVSGLASSANTLKVTPRGRGYRTSEAAAHDSGEEVTMQPRFPRYVVLARLNDVIQGAYPTLFAVGEDEFESVRDQYTYALPTDADGVLSVQRKLDDSDTWTPVRRWRFNTNSQAGNTVDIWDVVPEREYRVIYRKRPADLSVDGDFEDTGLAATARPAIVYGAIHRLAASLTLGTLDKSSAASNEFGRKRDVPAVEVAERYYALYQQFLNEERDRLLDLYPDQQHWEF